MSDDDLHQDADAHDFLVDGTKAPPLSSLQLTADEALFVKRLARDGVAGKHVMCLLWHFVIGLGKLAFALSAIAAAVALASGWRFHR